MTQPLTIDIPLPEPEHFRKMHVEPGGEQFGKRWVVRAGPSARSWVGGVQRRRLTVFMTDDKIEAQAVCAELQKRLSVARALLGLEV